MRVILDIFDLYFVFIWILRVFICGGFEPWPYDAAGSKRTEDLVPGRHLLVLRE